MFILDLAVNNVGNTHSYRVLKWFQNTKYT